jgi:hypothetical protein
MSMEMLKVFSEFGFAACVCAVLMYNVFFLQARLIALLQANVLAITAMQDAINALKDHCTQAIEEEKDARYRAHCSIDADAS